MITPIKTGYYIVEVFNGERSDSYFSTAYWDGKSWNFKIGTPEYNHHWCPNALVLSFLEIN